MKYKIGQIVRNKKLGIGKVLEIHGDEVTTYFKDEQTNPRTIDVSVAPMEIPTDQADEFFDGLSDAQVTKLLKPSKARKVTRTRASKAAAAEKTA